MLLASLGDQRGDLARQRCELGASVPDGDNAACPVHESIPRAADAWSASETLALVKRTPMLTDRQRRHGAQAGYHDSSHRMSGGEGTLVLAMYRTLGRSAARPLGSARPRTRRHVT